MSSPVARGFRCTRCGRPAAVHVRYARLKLCEDHFAEYVEGRFVGFAKRRRLFGGVGRVVVALSGGKDSLSLLHVLVGQKEGLGVGEVYGLHINLGLGSYSAESEEVVMEACRKLGVKCLVLDLKSLTGLSVSELSELSGRPPCSVCGTVKRYLANLVAVELGADAVAFGHHMDDLLRFAVKGLLVDGSVAALKLSPVAEGIPGLLARRVKPLYEVYESELELYARIRGIRTVGNTCPHKHVDSVAGAVGDMLDRIEREAPGFKLGLIRRFTRLWGRVSPEGVSRCDMCGMPSSGGTCAFCRITARAAGTPLGPEVRNRVRASIAALLEAHASPR